MLKTLKIFALVLVTGTLNAQIITNFGSGAFSDDLSYNSSTSTVTGTETLGAVILYGSSVTANLSGATGLSLRANVTTAPVSTFSVSLADSLGRQAIANFNWTSFTGGPITINTNFTSIQSGFNFSNVVDFNINSGNSNAALSAQFVSLAAIPEPSTAVILTGIASVGAVALRRRRSLI